VRLLRPAHVEFPQQIGGIVGYRRLMPLHFGSYGIPAALGEMPRGGATPLIVGVCAGLFQEGDMHGQLRASSWIALTLSGDSSPTKGSDWRNRFEFWSRPSIAANKAPSGFALTDPDDRLRPHSPFVKEGLREQDPQRISNASDNGFHGLHYNRYNVPSENRID
jgi:hypothetical protein